MKNFKKLMALVIAGAMVVGSMSMAFASSTAGDLTVDAQVKVTGFQDGDTVAAYQFIKWVDGSGWAFVDEGIADETGLTVEDIVDGLEKDELAALASADAITLMTPVSGTTSGGEWTFACGTMATAGSYLILVTDESKEYIYNPAVVSADFEADGAEVALTEDEAFVKKQPVTLDKEVDEDPDDFDVQVGDIVPFTVTVTVPQYNDNWVEPYFAVSDTLSTGLTIKAGPTIEGLEKDVDYKITSGGTEGDSGFKIEFEEDYLKEYHDTAIEIKYSALVGEAVKDTAQIHEETNKVTLEFSNNPEDSNDHNTIDDETHHYTFAIDASRFGSGSGSTNELIKVGVDSKGNTITAIQEDESWSTGVAPLAGAEFTLTGVGPNKAGEYSQTATSDANGRIFFNNLEVGTYTLKETKAPAGYIKDTSEHTVEITAEYEDDGVLKSYTITVDGNETNKGKDAYSATTDATTSKTSDITRSADNTKFPIGNLKGTELPSTGGMGTTLFYAIGAILVLGAGVLLVSKRRMSAN